MRNNVRTSLSVKKRLLLIDDAPDNLGFLEVLLGDKYHVFTFSSGGDALFALKEVRPDLLLLDILMFPMGGLDFLKAVRAVQEFGSIPAIAVTALARQAEQERLLAEGFQAVVTKPILDLRKLEATIARTLRSARVEADTALDGRYRTTA
jgi:CheY-like chemotaxis protein